MSSLQCKLILLGNGSVGKSSIVRRFVDEISLLPSGVFFAQRSESQQAQLQV